MKVRKKYSVVILPFRRLAVITKENNSWTKWIQINATCGATIFDCTLREAINNISNLKDSGYYIQKRRKGLIEF